MEARRADSRNLSRAVLLLLALAAALLLAAALSPTAMASAGGSLYTQTNDPSGNAVQTFDRGRDGSLTPAGTFPTGGAGLATLGGRQGAVEHRRAPRPRLRPELRRYAERHRVLAPLRRLARADPRRHPRARAGRATTGR